MVGIQKTEGLSYKS